MLNNNFYASKPKMTDMQRAKAAAAKNKVKPKVAGKQAPGSVKTGKSSKPNDAITLPTTTNRPKRPQSDLTLPRIIPNPNKKYRTPDAPNTREGRAGSTRKLDDAMRRLPSEKVVALRKAAAKKAETARETRRVAVPKMNANIREGREKIRPGAKIIAGKRETARETSRANGVGRSSKSAYAAVALKKGRASDAMMNKKPTSRTSAAKTSQVKKTGNKKLDLMDLMGTNLITGKKK